MKKLTAAFIAVCILLSAITVCAAQSHEKYGGAHIKILNYGEFPEQTYYV